MHVSGIGLGSLLSSYANPKVLEIGSEHGHTSEFLLANHPGLHLTCIDPYETYVDWEGSNKNEREEVLAYIKNRLQPYSDRWILYRARSDDMAAQFDDEQFDCVFIDGLHTYDQVAKDCANYYRTVKEGGIFSGHDYHLIEGVKKAVDEFAAARNKSILFTDNDVWYWIK